MTARLMRRRAVRRATDDRGSILPLVPVVLVAMLILGGLIVDGTRDLNARGDAQAYAEEAARAGATAVDFTSSTLALDLALARKRVDDYCTAVIASIGNPQVHVTSCGLVPGGVDEQFTDATTCSGSATNTLTTAQIVVNTKVQVEVDTTLLGIVHVSHLTASGYGKARPFTGTTAENAC